MLTFEKFSGINNVLPDMRLGPDALRTALNVDIGVSNEITRREGYSTLVDTCHKNLWQGDGFMLATADSDLKVVGGATIYPSLGADRVWYCNLPDGRTTFSNGLINGLTDGTTTSQWGVPVPATIGSAADISGDLFPGDYQYQLTYVRLSDGLEGGPAYSNAITIADGGIYLSGLPVLAGHKINVYLSSHNDGQGYLAGSTTNGLFSYIGENDALVLTCRTGYCHPAPVGTVTAFYRGRVLVAVDNVLYASRPNQWELFEIKRDFKQFSANITLICPVDDGVYVGTTDELAFLSGQTFDALQYRQVMSSSVVLGSGVSVRGDLIRLGDGRGQGSAMICIADSVICAGFNSGQVVRLTEGVYTTAVTEVAATFRKTNGIPQYIAIPQDVIAPPVDLSVTLVQTNRYDNAPSFYEHTLSSVSAFSPISLFASGEQGAWYDPSDLSTMFQDRAGTTPVTADGQPVGKILDKSGRGNHAVAPSDAARSLYKTDGTYHWLQFDGVDDSLSTEAVDFTGTDEMSVFSGIKWDSGIGMVVELGINGLIAGCFYLLAGTDKVTGFNFMGSGLPSGSTGMIATYVSTSPDTAVITSLFDVPGDLSRIRRNTVVGVDGTSDRGSLTLTNNSLFIGSRNNSSFRLNGNIYSLIVRGAISTTQEITDTETWVNGKTGAY